MSDGEVRLMRDGRGGDDSVRPAAGAQCHDLANV